MFKKIMGWGLLVLGTLGVLLGLLALVGGENEGGGTLLGIGVVLAATGWGLRGPGRAGNSGDSGPDHDWDSRSHNSDSDSGDSGSDFGGDSGD